MLELPITTDPAQEFTIQLGELSAKVTILYNSISGIWTLSLLNNVTQVSLLEGVALVLGTDLLGAFNYGIGSLVCVDYIGSGVEATLDTITTQVGVVWFSPDEV